MEQRQQVEQLRYQLRQGSASEWMLKNPVLLSGEEGYDKTLKRTKIGDGYTRWSDLPYQGVGSGTDVPLDLSEHINDPTPHPAYDDGLSFALLYQNAKV